MDINLHSNRAVPVMEDHQLRFVQIDTPKIGHNTKYHSEASKFTLELPFLFFGGLLINSDDCPACFVWIQHIAPIKYGFEVLMKIFWGRIETIACNAAVENCVAATGAQVLQTYSMVDRTTSSDTMILLAINVAFHAIEFLGLWLSLRESK